MTENPERKRLIEELTVIGVMPELLEVLTDDEIAETYGCRLFIRKTSLNEEEVAHNRLVFKRLWSGG